MRVLALCDLARRMARKAVIPSTMASGLEPINGFGTDGFQGQFGILQNLDCHLRRRIELRRRIILIENSSRGGDRLLSLTRIIR
jgi:hypothetical protein